MNYDVTTLQISATIGSILTSTPLIDESESDIYDGRRINLVNTGSNEITLQDNSVLPGTKLNLVNPYKTLSIDSSILLEYDETTDLWVELSSRIPQTSFKQTNDFLFGPSDPLTVQAGYNIIPFSLSYSWTAVTTPFISASGLYDGRKITLINTSSSNCTLQDDGTLVGSGLELTASTVDLNLNDSLELMYDTSTSKWVQVGNVVNIV